MGATKASVTISEVDLRAVVESAVKVVAFPLKGINLTINQYFEDDPPLLSGDERFLKKIVINLLTSAMKSTNEGGRIRVKIEKINGGALKLQVTDTGTGILADDIPKLTPPFFKSADSERLAGGSLGFGLVITLELVEIHEGVLSVQS